MLSANREMSNIFLQICQNIDGKHKKGWREVGNLWKRALIKALLTLTKRSARPG
jgi:hypothetical protein